MKTIEFIDILERVWFCFVFFFAFTSSIVLMNHYFGEKQNNEQYCIDDEITKLLVEN